MTVLHDEAVRLIERLAEHQSGGNPVRCPTGGLAHSLPEPVLTDQGVVLRCTECGHAVTDLPVKLDCATFHPEIGREERDIAQQRPPC